MNRFIAGVFALVSFFSASGQSKLVAVSKSSLTGIELPAGTMQDNRILSTASAKTLLQMKAEENKLTGSDQVEVFTMPPFPGNQALEQIKSTAARAGWQLQPFTNEVTYSLLTKNQQTVLMYLESMKKETALYLLKITSSPPPAINTSSDNTTVVIVQSKKEQLETEPAKSEIETAVTAQQEQTPITTKNGSNEISPSHSIPDGFTFSTTNFDDGWTSTIETDWIKVTNGKTQVLLYYPIQSNDEIRATHLEPRDYFWNLLVAPNFAIKTAYPLNESLTYFKVHFTEAEATDHAGKPVYLAMTVLINSGVYLPVLAIAPDKATYYQFFPEPKNLGNMTGYNRFAVSLNDIIGDWSANSGASVNLYNVYTGNYAGMNYASSSDAFSFNGNGTYSSKHSGASSVYGNNTYYDQKYNGKLSVTNWDMSLTNRWKDATEDFNIWFEVVRGGRILHLQDKKASGITYNLVKIK